MHRARDAATGALHLGVASVADEDHLALLLRVADRLAVHLRHEGAGRVDHAQVPRATLGDDGVGDAVRAEDRQSALRHLRELAHEHRALGAEVLDDVLVVHDLVQHVDRRAVAGERLFDDLDRAIDTRAEAAWVRQLDLGHQCGSSRA